MPVSSASMRVSFIATVYNEDGSVGDLLKSLLIQSKLPDEIIIVDGGSSDRTVAKIKSEKLKMKDYHGRFKVLLKKGNRAVGRNEAINNATGGIVVCSDAGCALGKDWIKSIIEPFHNFEVDVVAGYYKGKAKTFFEKCIIPYFLVMEDRIDPNNFLPATRSIAFKKSIWHKVGGFDERYSYNEDFVFAKKLKEIKAKIVFNKNAIVYWLPKKNLKEAWIAFYRFALGDAEAKIFRPKVVILFLRCILALFVLILFFITKLVFVINILLILVIIYIFWSIVKNYKYINNWNALYFLPVIQIVSDLAVMSGTVVGLYSAKIENE